MVKSTIDDEMKPITEREEAEEEDIFSSPSQNFAKNSSFMAKLKEN